MTTHNRLRTASVVRLMGAVIAVSLAVSGCDNTSSGGADQPTVAAANHSAIRTETHSSATAQNIRAAQNALRKSILVYDRTTCAHLNDHVSVGQPISVVVTNSQHPLEPINAYIPPGPTIASTTGAFGLNVGPTGVTFRHNDEQVCSVQFGTDRNDITNLPGIDEAHNNAIETARKNKEVCVVSMGTTTGVDRQTATVNATMSAILLVRVAAPGCAGNVADGTVLASYPIGLFPHTALAPGQVNF